MEVYRNLNLAGNIEYNRICLLFKVQYEFIHDFPKLLRIMPEAYHLSCKIMLLFLICHTVTMQSLMGSCQTNQRKGIDIYDYYEDYYYNDEDHIDNYNRIERIDLLQKKGRRQIFSLYHYLFHLFHVMSQLLRRTELSDFYDII